MIRKYKQFDKIDSLEIRGKCLYIDTKISNLFYKEKYPNTAEILGELLFNVKIEAIVSWPLYRLFKIASRDLHIIGKGNDK